jgi:gliotoxin/aspirochlorine biosynthesis peptide synthetase
VAALKVLSYLRSKNLELGIKTLFEVPDLKTASENITENTTAEQKGENPPSSANANGVLATQESRVGPMTALQMKMIQASLRIPGANTMLIRIRIPHAGEQCDRRSLKEAWQRVLNRHSIFRTTFTLRDELQHVKPDLVFDWSEENTTEELLDDVVRTRSSTVRRKIVDLKLQDDTFTPTTVFHLITVPKVCSIFLFSAHHAQADGWSFSLVLDEVQKVLRGAAMTGWREPLSFIDVAVAQNKQQRSPEGARFWTSALKNASDLPKITFPRPASSQVDQWTRTLKLDLGFKITDLERVGRDLHVAPSALIYTAWALVLSMYTSSNNVAFGAVFSGRNLTGVSDVDHAVGPLLTTVPFPVEFENGQTVSHAVKNMHNRLLQMLELQWSAVEAMAPMARETIDRLLQTLVVTEYDLPPSTEASWAVEREDLMEFALTLLLERSSRHGRLFGDSKDDQYLQARILYDGSQITELFIRRLLTYFMNSITGLISMSYNSLRDVRA